MDLVLMMPACEGGRRARVKHTTVNAEELHACRAITDGAMACRGEHRSGNLMPPAGGYQAMPSAFDGGLSNCPSGCSKAISRLHCYWEPNREGS